MRGSPLPALFRPPPGVGIATVLNESQKLVPVDNLCVDLEAGQHNVVAAKLVVKGESCLRVAQLPAASREMQLQGLV